MVHPSAKVSEQLNSRRPSLGARLYNFQHTLTLSPQTLHSQKFRNFTYLLHLAFLTAWPFCLCSQKDGRVLLSRWSIIMHASYAVRSAISATAGLLVKLCRRVKSDLISRDVTRSPIESMTATAWCRPRRPNMTGLQSATELGHQVA